jgi:putative peptidoglycan lipid II flippase
MTSEAIPGSSASPLRALGATAAFLATLAAFGQAFVVLREVYTAAQAGISADLDALLVALVLPSVAVGILSSSTQAALVPAVIAATRARGRDAGRALAAAVLWSVVGVALLIALLIWLFAEAAIAISGPGIDPARQETARSYIPILLPLVVLAPAGTLLAAVCQVQDRFRAIALSWIGGPVAALVVTLSLWDTWGVGALAWATTADAVVTAVILVAALALRGELPLPARGVKLDELYAFARHAGPLSIGSSVLQLNLLADRAVASLIAAGAVSALRYGERIIRAPTSILMPAWSTTFYPTIARTGVDPDDTALSRTASDALRFVVAAFLPLSIATMAMAPMIVALAYQRGQFDAAATIETAGVLAALAPLILLWLVHPILSGAHNARRRGGLLAWNAIANAVANLALDIVLGLAFGVAGVALSTSITGWVLTGYLALRLRDLETDFDLRGVGRVAVRSLAASLVPAIPLAVLSWVVRPSLDAVGLLLVLTAATIGGAAAYLLASRFLGLREPWIVATAVGAAARARLRPAS